MTPWHLRRRARAALHDVALRLAGATLPHEVERPTEAPSTPAARVLNEAAQLLSLIEEERG